MSNGNSAEASTSPSPAPSSIGNNAPKFGTLVPNRVFVGGISGNTTEQDLLELFTKYGKVKATKVISDRAGVSKGYGFVTFETEEEARKLTQEADNIMLKDRKLNIAPAIKKQVNDLGYIKPYSPRLVDGTAAATVLGTNGTVFFGNGTTYAYTNPVPMLANHSDYHQAVAGVQAPTAAHPTFPPQVPQTGAHTAAVSAATQVGGTPTAGYPAQFVYPQTMYFPQQYHHHLQTAAALQPQWTTSPQWRWVSPSAYAQPGPGYITTDGLYTQAAATYVPGSSFLSSEASTSDQSGTKGTQASSPPPPSLTPNSFSLPSFPPPPVHNCVPVTPHSHHSSTPPIMHSYNPHFSYSPANASVSSPPLHVVSTATSVTTMTTTTTTAVIGSGSTYTQRERKRQGNEAFENGILEIKPLANGSGTSTSNKATTNGIQLENFATYTYSNGQNSEGIEHCPLHQTVSSTPRHKSKKKPSISCSTNMNSNSESSSSSSSEESTTRMTSSNLKACLVNEKNGLSSKCSFDPEYRNSEYSTPSPGFGTQSSTQLSSNATPSPPLYNQSQSSSPVREAAEIETLPVASLTSWCPQHNPRSIPFHLWTPTSASNSSFCSSTCKSTNASVTPFHRICERASISQRDSLHTNDMHGQIGSSLDSKKLLIGSREESLIGKPFLKMSGTAAKSQYGMIPQGPVMMVPLYQYGSTVSPSWFPCQPFVTFLPPSHCSFHPPSANAHSHSQSHFFTHHSPSSPLEEEVGLSHLSSLTVPQQPPSSVPQTQAAACNITPLPSNTSAGGSLNVKGGSSASWWLNRAAFGVPTTRSSTETSCMVPIERGIVATAAAATNHVPTSEVGGLSCFNPIMRGSLPFIGEPVRCFQRLTQLPEDRCALLPISPPLTPHQLEYDPNGLSTLNRD